MGLGDYTRMQKMSVMDIVGSLKQGLLESLVSLVVSLFLSCFILSIQQSHSCFRPHSFLPRHMKKNRLFYSCVFSDLALVWKRGWG